MQSSLPLIAQGRLKALAVSGDTRNKTLPQIPAANEVITNYPSIVGFVALYAPIHTPARQLEQLMREVNKVVWPTRKESTQMTLYVFAFVVIMALFLWLTDKTLEWVFYDLILGWKK